LGRWLALSAARAGFRVLLEDVMPANLHTRRSFSARNSAPPPWANSQASRWLPMVAFVSTIEDAVREADWPSDCVPDELESKLEILWLLDRMAPPRTVLATPTTRLSIADWLPAPIARQVRRHRRRSPRPGPKRRLPTPPAHYVPHHSGDRGPAHGFWQRLGFTPTFVPDPTSRLPLNFDRRFYAFPSTCS